MYRRLAACLVATVAVLTGACEPSSKPQESGPRKYRFAVMPKSLDFQRPPLAEPT